MARMRTWTKKRNRLAGEARTRDRSMWERDQPIKLKEMQIAGDLRQERMRGNFGLDNRTLANSGNMAVRKLANIGQLDTQRLTNKGALTREALGNAGRLAVQNAADVAANSRNAANNNASSWRNQKVLEAKLKLKQLGLTSTVSENAKDRRATAETPVYADVYIGADEQLNPIYAKRNINTVTERAKSKSGGAISPAQARRFASANSLLVPSHNKIIPNKPSKKLGSIQAPRNTLLNSRFGRISGMRGVSNRANAIVNAGKNYYKNLFDYGIVPGYNYLSAQDAK